MAKASVDRYLVMAVVSADQNGEFSWADGMRGVCPVFTNKRKAYAYAKKIGGAEVLKMVSTGKNGVDLKPLAPKKVAGGYDLDPWVVADLVAVLKANERKKPNKAAKDLVARYVEKGLLP